MGETQEHAELPDAAGGRASGRLAPRLALSRFARDENGGTVIEYGLIAALVFLVIVGAMTAFSDNTKAMFDMIAEKIGGS